MNWPDVDGTKEGVTTWGSRILWCRLLVGEQRQAGEVKPATQRGASR
jgi:hypothetical protein